MPDTMTISANVKCPICDKGFRSVLSCQWGSVPGPIYEIGDSVLWVCDGEGVAPPFSLRSGGDGVWRWNYGTPDFDNVILLDLDTKPGQEVVRCPECGCGFVGWSATAHHGYIESVSLVNDGDLIRMLGDPPVLADAIVVRDDGSFDPRSDWYDYPLDTSRLVDSDRTNGKRELYSN